jgi:hypothetical protein
MAHVTERERKAIAVLWLQHNIVWILISITNNTEERSFDAFVSNFEEVVNLAESTIGAECPISWSQRWARYNFQLQNISPLYMAATKCRNPTIRRKALALLKGSDAGRALWHMNVTIKVAERVIELEEEGLKDLRDATGDAVPSEWARIHDSQPLPRSSTIIEGSWPSSNQGLMAMDTTGA